MRALFCKARLLPRVSLLPVVITVSPAIDSRGTRTQAVKQRGQRIGMIKFGSRTDLIVPADSSLEPAVKTNDHVKGGETILIRPKTHTVRHDSTKRKADELIAADTE